jgi:hypothetical protein
LEDALVSAPQTTIEVTLPTFTACIPDYNSMHFIFIFFLTDSAKQATLFTSERRVSMTNEQRKEQAEALYSMAYYEFINGQRSRESLKKLREELDRALSEK